MDGDRPATRTVNADADEEQIGVEAAARAHRRVATAIIGTILILYLGLILLIALAKPLLGRLVVPGLSLAILLGALVTVAAWVLTLVYVKWANGYYDRAVRRLRS